MRVLEVQQFPQTYLLWGLNNMLSAKKITLPVFVVMLSATTFLTSTIGICNAAPTDAQAAKTPAKSADKKEADKKDSKEPAVAKAPEPDLSNAVTITPDELVKKPHEYLNKNVKFTANFSSFSALALDYPKDKPMRSSKNYLSLLVFTPGSKIPLSELKLAMAIPKDKDPETELLSKLKDGDQIEIIGKQFSAALDDPWLDVFKLKKIGGSKDEDKKVAAGESDKKNDAKSAEKSTEKPATEGK
jgi:hypothetical protein